MGKGSSIPTQDDIKDVFTSLGDAVRHKLQKVGMCRWFQFTVSIGEFKKPGTSGSSSPSSC